jgi:hypothetical protein
MWTDPGGIYKSITYTQFPEKVYIYGIFVAVQATSELKATAETPTTAETQAKAGMSTAIGTYNR